MNRRELTPDLPRRGVAALITGGPRCHETHSSDTLAVVLRASPSHAAPATLAVLTDPGARAVETA